ncbi:hypothetical protein HKT54_27400, partial [Pseudomonas aeruginosa]|nr:hypothetical protein [Pseudomonas aeruginosa]
MKRWLGVALGCSGLAIALACAGVLLAPADMAASSSSPPPARTLAALPAVDFFNSFAKSLSVGKAIEGVVGKS